MGTSTPSFTTPPLTTETSYGVHVSNNCGSADSATMTITIGISGDANGDHSVTAGDIIYLITYLLAGGPEPSGPADANRDGAVDMLDVFYLINFLFSGGPAPVQAHR